MNTKALAVTEVNPVANVYFDGKCISHNIVTTNNERKSVGVILPGQLNFKTGAAEIMECVGGSCRYRLQGSEQWLTCSEGQSFAIAENASFDIDVSATPFHYLCHYA